MTDQLSHRRTNEISVLSLDDDELTLDGLRLLAAQEYGMAFHATTTSREFLEMVRRLQPDVTVNDLRLSGTDYAYSGLEVLPEIKRLSPKTRCIVLTYFATATNLQRALKHQVEGFLEKGRTNGTKLMAAIRRVADGGRIYDSEVVAMMYDLTHTAAGRDLQKKGGLTEREKQVLRLVLQYDWTNRQIADSLSVGEESIKSHLKHASEKLGVKGRREVALNAQMLGLL
jgi:DNA-binding NarL/FixJ family response regulator